MNDSARLLAIVYGAAVIAVVVIALIVIRSTRRPASDLDHEKVEKREWGWFAIVLLSTVVLVLTTFPFHPWRVEARSDRQVVRVTAVQFGWTLDPPGPYEAGRQIEFVLRASDVNHGFGLFDPDDVFVVQAQVLPDRDTRLRATLDKPGTYTITCFEYCGVLHHRMLATFEVAR